MIIDVVGNRGISIFISQSEVMAKVAKVASARHYCLCIYWSVLMRECCIVPLGLCGDDVHSVPSCRSGHAATWCGACPSK